MLIKIFLKCSLFFLLVFLTKATVVSYYSLPRLDRVTSAVLISADSGQILFEQNTNHRVNPGTLIQLMTIELAINALDEGDVNLDTMIKLPKDIQHMETKKVFSYSGERVKFYNLLESIAIVSAGDACFAIAHYLGGSRNSFIDLMNRRAKELKLHSTLIGDSCGSIEDTTRQYTTAHDMAQLAYYHITRHPELLTLYSKSYFSLKGTHYRNKNYLLDYDEHIDGLKCAQLNERTFHIITTGSWNGARYIAVIMGAKSRKMAAYYAVKLLYQGFTIFENVRLFEKGESVADVRVWKGKVDRISLVTGHRVIVTVPKGKRQNLIMNEKISKLLVAPINKNKKVGELDIVLEEDIIKSIDLYPSQKIERGHLFKRMWHSFLLKFR